MISTARHPHAPIDDRIRDLRNRGLSFEVIAIVLDTYEGWHLTAGQVRYRCDQMGMPKNPRKIRRRARGAA